MGRKKILVVDYDQSILANLEQILTGEGYEVILAGDGQAAWDKYNQEDPDLVLMEAMLSKIHGFELCQRITSIHERRVPVFIMTGVYKDRVYRTEALRSYGASEYFEKPLKITEILTSIEAVIGKPEPEPEPASEPEPDLAPGYAEASAASAAGLHKIITAEPRKPETAAAAHPGAPASVSAMREDVPAEPRKPEKPKAANGDNGWAFDLEQLEKDIPRIMSDQPPRPEKKKAVNPKPPADDLVAAALKSFPKIAAEKPHEQKNNGNDGVDIDSILKSALADFDLSADKKKAPEKPKAPPPPVPTPPAPKPRAAAPYQAAPSVEKPKPVPPRPPVVPPPPVEPAKPAPRRETPQPPPAAKPADRPLAAPPAPAAAVAASPSPKPRAEEKPGAESHSPPWEVPAAAPDELRRSVIEDAKLRQRIPTGLFDEDYEKKRKAGFPPVVAGGVAVVVLATAAFFIFRPKPKPPAPVSAPSAASMALPENVEEKAPETAFSSPAENKPEPKPAAPAPKKPSTNGAAQETSVAAEDAAMPIAPIQPTVNPGFALQAPAENKPEEKKPEPPPAKEPQAAMADPVKTEAAVEVASAPAAPVKEGDLVNLIDVDKPPTVVRRVEAAYPPAALRLGIEGPITVNALIDETGKVLETGILRGMKDDRGLERAAQTAVKKWRFDPARKNGVNVKVWMPVVVVFKLADGEGN